MDSELVYTQHRKNRKVHQIIVDSAIWSSVGSIVPIPFFDVASVMAIQLKMINELSYEYDIDFNKNINKSVLISLLGGITTDYLGKQTFGMLASRFALGVDFKQVSTSLWAGAITYAIGKVFQAHFESGGELMDFRFKNYKKQIHEQATEALVMLKNRNLHKAQAA